MFHWLKRKYQEWLEKETCKHCQGTGEITKYNYAFDCTFTSKCIKCDGEGVR